MSIFEFPRKGDKPAKLKFLYYWISFSILPESRTYVMTPTDHISDPRLTGSYWITSGETKSGVPCITQRSFLSLSILDKPKSTSLILKLLMLSQTIFSGLISRWIIFLEWMYCNPEIFIIVYNKIFKKSQLKIFFG